MRDFTKYLLIPYQHGGRDYSGADCYGLLRLFYLDELGIKIKDYTDAYGELWWTEADYFMSLYKEYGFEESEAPQFGDVILFNNNAHTVGHCGLVLDDGMFLHMSRKGPVIMSYQRGAYSRCIRGTFRYANMK